MDTNAMDTNAMDTNAMDTNAMDTVVWNAFTLVHRRYVHVGMVTCWHVDMAACTSSTAPAGHWQQSALLHSTHCLAAVGWSTERSR